MFVLDVIPLSRTAPPDPLSYRSAKELPLGTLVTVPLRKREVPALVIACVPVAEAKATLKGATFSLSRSALAPRGSLPNALVTAATQVATYHATTLGAVLAALVIPILREEDLSFSRNARGLEHTATMLEASLLDRCAAYAKIISESAGATLLLVPSETELRAYAARFAEFKPTLLSGTLTPKRRDAVLQKATETKGLILATPSFCWVPVASLQTIIVERASAGSYQLPQRPYIDVRVAVHALAEARNISYVFGDYPLPMEYRPDPTAALSVAPTHTTTILDVRPAAEEARRWQALHDDLRYEIGTAVATGGRAAVLAVRKGYAPVVVCRDCGTSVTDVRGRNLSFSIVRGERLFRSADGVTIQSTDVVCEKCGSWNLVPLGVGVERVEEELREAFPDAHVFRIDERATSQKARAAIEEQLQIPGSIIVGTEQMLPWLRPETPLELGAIASADTLLALPFWRARERFVRIGLLLAERAQKTIVATRHPDDAAVQALANPTQSNFWKEESDLRAALHYPPYGTLIVFTIEGTDGRIQEARSYLADAVSPQVLLSLPPRIVSGTTLRATSVLQVPSGSWPNPVLAEKLSYLPPTIRVHIDSETLW